MEKRFAMFPERSVKPISNVVSFEAAQQIKQGLDKHLSKLPPNAMIDAQTSETRPSFWLRLFLSFSAACCIVSVMPISGAQPGQGDHPDEGHDVGG